MNLTIGQLANATGTKVPTIRYYEGIGLLPAVLRTASNRRMYDEVSTRRLRFIRHARELGFELDAIRTLLNLQEKPEAPCGDVDAIAHTHLAAVRQRISRLTALGDELERMVSHHKHGSVAECRIIEALTE